MAIFLYIANVEKKIILNVTPATHVRTTQNDKWFFRIPREKLREAGLKRLERIEKYNNYKIELLAEAKRKNFDFPPQGACITFYIPVPKSWSKKKKKQYHGKIHQSTPDLSNLLKAAEDALLLEDKYIGHYGELCKRWVDFESGWIEITIKEPTEQLINPPPKQNSRP